MSKPMKEKNMPPLTKREIANELDKRAIQENRDGNYAIRDWMRDLRNRIEKGIEKASPK